jgi:uncharacterized membrane protein required for colicin V production
MIIDIIILVLVLLATILGMRQGLITQLCYLIAIILTSLIAPSMATTLGSKITDNQGIAFITGFGIILLVAILLVWIVAPLLKKIIRWEKIRKINAILGAATAFASMIIIIAVACSTINTLNLGDVRMDKIEKLSRSYNSKEQMSKDISKLASKDASMRDYFEPRFIAYETLDDSMLFGFMTKLGDVVCPGLSTLQQNATNNFKTHASKAITNTFTEE